MLRSNERCRSGNQVLLLQHSPASLNRQQKKDIILSSVDVIGGTLLPIMKVHKATWVSPNHVTENQIYHICISQCFRRSMLDVRAKRGAGVAKGLGHHLLIGKLKLELKRFPKRTDNRYNITLLQDQAIVVEQFRISLSHRFQALKDLHLEDQSLENKWQRARKTWMDTCKETVGRKTRQHKEWITA